MSTDRVTVDGDAGHVNFTRVNKTDEGTYTCTAVNVAGNDSHTAQLVVRGTFFFFFCGMHHWEYVAPYVDRQPLQWTVLSQVDCFVECEVVGGTLIAFC